ncbi:hypothetical protein SAMN02745221_01443 [Thermosyntropha lipolytica DSM 11003]|uniref:Nuclease SbcCD subunit C n=1 Tax=Thermosyntropha lipolytica DSM 11003 TaxID=1123382 RepID=A0A1M5PDS7_9FIRM|nr:hypothetical protein [Thermosyntropha lipolytica]SHG99921.1 hypothetical protein SAMN02745221_01443 [Thermosyntropha lipolytica DSM 11003]
MVKDDLEQAYAALDAEVKRREGEREKIKQIIASYEREKKELEAKIALYVKVNEIYKKAAEYARENSKSAIESIVSRALEIIFPGDIAFKIELSEKGNKPAADFLVSSTLVNNLVMESDPQEARGGGVVDILSLALRIALMETCRIPQHIPLVLDEPAKHVSDEYIKNVALFLEEVVKAFNRQIIMVTHNPYLASSGDRIYEVKMDNGESVVIPKT